MKIPVSTFRVISILWALFFFLEITAFIYTLVTISPIPTLAQLTLAATIVSGLLTILLFYVNQFIFNSELKILSNVSFSLSTISIGGIVYWYSTTSRSVMITNLVLLCVHLLIFWKSNSYYRYREAKKSGTLTVTPEIETSKPVARKTGREWIEGFLRPPDHDNSIIDSPDFLKLNKDDDGVMK